MQNIVTLGEINDALKIAAVTAAQLADMGFAALANKPICEGLPPEESRRLRNAKLYPAESIGQIRVALAQRLAAPAPVQAISPTFAVHAGDSKVTLHFSSEAEALEFYRTAKFDAGNPGNKAPQAVPDERKDLVPGVMRCAKCEFQLVRQVLAVNLGEVFAGDSKTEPCPNDCGPLWPVTWKQYAEQAMDAAESMADRAFAAEKEVKQLRGELSALDAPSLRAKVMSTPLGLYGTGIGDIGIAYRAGHRAALLTAADLVASTVVAAPAAVAWSMPAEPTEQMIEVLMAGEDRLRARHGDDLPKQRAKDRYRALLSLAATPAAAQVADQISINLIDKTRSPETVIDKAAAPVVLPEPDAWLAVYEDRDGNSKFYTSTHKDLAVENDTNGKPQPLYTEQKVSALLAGVSAPAAHFRASVTPNSDKWKLVDGDMREAGDGLLTYHADAYREGLADGALLATATGLPAQAVEPSDAELIALNAGECFFSESPSKYPELGHGTQYHGGAPGVIGFARAALALRADPAGYSQKFQQRVQPWMMACFGPEISANRMERNHRFLEEALELVQSCGCTASEAHQLVDYVYGRPWGEPAQETGGVMVTLAALCLANGLDMHACGETELARIWTNVEAIRAKQAAKPKHSPLPMQAHQTQDALRLAFVLSEIRRDGMDALTAALHDLDGFPLDHQASVEAIDRAAIAAAKGDGQ